MALPDFSEPPSRWRTFWPDVSDMAGALEAIRLALWFTTLSVSLSAIGAVVALLGGADIRVVVVSIVFTALIGLGLQRRWRLAASVGFCMAALGFVGRIAAGGLPGAIQVLTLVAMLNGVRGTFAYADLAQTAGETATPEDGPPASDAP